jgi:hypothetical protein
MLIFGPLWLVLLVMLIFMFPTLIYGIALFIMFAVFFANQTAGIIIGIVILGVFAVMLPGQMAKQRRLAKKQELEARLAWEANVELISQGMERAAHRVKGK